MISSSSLRFAPNGNTAFFLRPTFAAGSVISQQNFSFLGVEKQADFLPLLPFDRKNDDVLFKAQSEVIRAIAEKGDAVIIGRCADYILRDLPCLNVFVTGPEEYRISRIVKSEGISPEEAEKLIRKKDRTRETYYNYYTLGSWGSASNYHLSIDSSVLGIEGTADYIIEFGRKAGLVK